MIFLKSRFTYFVIVYGIAISWLIYHPAHKTSPSIQFFPDCVKCIEYLTCTVWCFLFAYLFLVNPGRYLKGKCFYFYNGKISNGKVFKNNRFYCWLMFITSLVLFYANIHLINVYHEDVKSVFKVWEITAYWVTTFYTGWFWLNKKRGGEVLATLPEKQGETGIFLGVAITLLFGFAVIHTFLFFSETFNDGIGKFIEENDAVLSLFLIILVYGLFMFLNMMIMKSKDEEVSNEVSIMHRYIDRPTLFIFVIMFAVAAYSRSVSVVCLSDMKSFFSGAIAFELILSSIVWANTNTF